MSKLIPLFLTGGAFSVYIGLSEDTRKNYKEVKSALINIFSSDKFTVYESLMFRKLRLNESVDVYLADIKRMIYLIDEFSSDELLKTAFVFGLPDNVKTQLRAACSLTEMSLDMIVQRTRGLMKSNSSREICFVSQAKNNVSQKSKSLICYQCGKEGHARNRCPSLKERRCFRCGEVNHIIANCPKNAVENKSTPEQKNV